MRTAKLLRLQMRLAGLERHLNALGLQAEAAACRYILDDLAEIRVRLP